MAEFFDPIENTLAGFVKLCEEQEKRACFRVKLGLRHDFFAKQKQEHPRIFIKFLFQQRAGFKYCPEIETYFESLEMARLLGGWGLNNDPYELKPEPFIKTYNELSKRRRTTYRQIGQEFLTQLGCDRFGRRTENPPI